MRGIVASTWVLSAIALGAVLSQAPAKADSLHVRSDAETFWNELIDSYWARKSVELEDTIRSGLEALPDQEHDEDAALYATAVSVRSMNFSLEPAIDFSSSGDAQSFTIQMPKSTTGWSATFDTTLHHTILGDMNATIQIKNLRATQKVTINTADATRPKFAGVGDMELSFETEVDTPNVFLAVIDALAPALLRDTLRNGLLEAVGSLNTDLAGEAGTTWGTGGSLSTRLLSASQTSELHAAAVSASSDIATAHAALSNTVLYLRYSSSTYGSGTIEKYKGLRDSAIYTGMWLAGEALRYGVTTDGDALTNVAKGVAGIKLLLDVQDPSSGRLARYAIPQSKVTTNVEFEWPEGDAIERVTLDGVNYYWGDGQNGISRDQYLGVMFGLATAYDVLGAVEESSSSSTFTALTSIEALAGNQYLTSNPEPSDQTAPAPDTTTINVTVAPGAFAGTESSGLELNFDATSIASTTRSSTRASAKSLIHRIVSFLEEHDWVALKTDGTTATAFLQAPVQMIAFARAAERTAPNKFASTASDCSKLASLVWFTTWLGTIDAHNDYFKWNLNNMAFYMALRYETDPTAASDLERAFNIMRETIGHHRNALSDGVAASVGAYGRTSTISSDLYDFVSCGRRARSVDNLNDSSIEKAVYTPVSMGSFALFGTESASREETIAKYPIPVRKRPSTDHLWSQSPFTLSSSYTGSRLQAPGVDIVLPYWLGRYHGSVDAP